MPAALTNSNERLPIGGWPRAWLLAAALFAIIMGTWEAVWRLKGWLPTVESNQESWVLARESIRPNSTVLTGTSRIQGAIDPDVWASVRGGDVPVQLAVAGGSPIPVLESLSADTTFHGLVIADMLPFYAFDVSHDAQAVTLEYLRAYAYAEHSPAKRWEAYLRTHIAGHFVYRRANLLPGDLIPALRAGTLRTPPAYIQRPDRYHPLLFRQMHIASNEPAVLDSSKFAHLRRVTRPATGARLDSLMARIERSVHQIQARGGRVAFVFFEPCGGRRPVEEELYPKDQYWKRLTAMQPAYSIDSDDYPVISTLPCFDGSHIDQNDAPAVTRQVAALVSGPPSVAVSDSATTPVAR
ncbi:MAG: hypothetical protein ABJD11_02140 [Gemmatimonadota bacterium]